MTGKFVFINMPTKNVAAAREFYTKLGFDINTVYSSDANVFVIVTEDVQLILASEAFIKRLGEPRDFADASKVTEASVAISMSSREEVDKVFELAIAAGAKPFGDTVEEKEIGLYARAFFDLDNHKIDLNYMSV